MIFIKFRFRTIHELETFGTLRDVAVPESVQSCFELPIYFPVFFQAHLCLFLTAVHDSFAGKDL